ncbi:MAG: photosystem II biogenesis protein Psp29 [Oscillatoriales cyanobacterium]|nr:MAG: photosystem II biogenesis protein Psp29 [Oscillatoriales cyanobacterium]
MDSVRTVSDTKREFYSLYTRPIDSIYRRVVEELLVEMHLLSVNADFNYDAIYALGVVTVFDRFMAGYRTDSERDAIFQALCQATGRSVEQYRTDATALMDSLEGLSAEDFKAAIDQTESQNPLKDLFATLAQRERMKYSRLFGIGICTILDRIAPDLANQREEREALLSSLSQFLTLGGDKLQKDVDLYRSNLEKMKLAREAMADAVAAERKKRDKRQAELAEKQAAEAAKEAPAEEATETPSSDTEAATPQAIETESEG